MRPALDSYGATLRYPRSNCRTQCHTEFPKCLVTPISVNNPHTSNPLSSLPAPAASKTLAVGSIPRIQQTYQAVSSTYTCWYFGIWNQDLYLANKEMLLQLRTQPYAVWPLRKILASFVSQDVDIWSLDRSNTFAHRYPSWHLLSIRDQCRTVRETLYVIHCARYCAIGFGKPGISW